MRGNHGKDSKFIHIRIRHPGRFTKMRTIDLGNNVKQVLGKVKGKKQWLPQNVMIPKTKVKKHGDKVSIKTKKMRDHLRNLGISVSKIKRMKGRGENDYKHPIAGRMK